MLLACVALLALSAPAAEASHRKQPKPRVVKAVQKKLGIPADGIVGPQTRRAVRRFQRRRGLTVDGVIGPQTLRALGLRRFARAKRKRRASRRAVPASELLARIAECESGGDPTAVSPSGRYRGKYQFSRATWRAVGGSGDPADAPEEEQDRLALVLYEQDGIKAWPTCGRKARRQARRA